MNRYFNYLICVMSLFVFAGILLITVYFTFDKIINVENPIGYLD